MIGHVYPTRRAALDAVEVIDAALGPTEELRDEDTGQVRVVPRKPWAIPVPLRTGAFLVPWRNERLVAIAGRVVDVKGVPKVVPSLASAVVIAPGDVEPAAVALEPEPQI